VIGCFPTIGSIETDSPFISMGSRNARRRA
jgi:hypothetical protein